MSGSNPDDAGFFIESAGTIVSVGEPRNGGPADSGDATEGSQGHAKEAGDGEANAGPFGGIEPAKKKRGRPPGSKNRPKSSGASQDGFGPGLALGSEDAHKDLKKQATALAVTIQQRHLMLAVMLGIPELALPPEKAEGLAIALLNFQSEYPSLKVSRKLTVAVDLATAAGMAYLPAFASVADRVRKANEAKRQKRAGVNYPTVNPAFAEKQENEVKAPETKKQGETPSEMILASGVPSGGKIDFGPH